MSVISMHSILLQQQKWLLKQTSLNAYLELVEELGRRQRQVYNCLCHHINGLTRLELSEKLQKPINSICGRVNELLKMKLITEAGTKLNPYTNKQAMILKVCK